MAFPEDRPNRIVLGGLAAILLGLFLPWVHLRIPGFFGGIDTDFSAISGGTFVWVLVVLLTTLGTFMLCQRWLYRRHPQTPRWLLSLPFAAGIFMGTVSFSILALLLSLQAKLAEIGGGIAESLISAQIGVYLVLLGSLFLTVGGYQKLVREHGAPL